MTRGALLVVAVLLLLPTVGQAQRVYSVENRTLYISQALAGLRASRPEFLRNLYKYLYAIERNACRAPTEIMRVDCLIEAARQNCKQRNSERAAECERVSDVVITNRISEREFIPRAAAQKIMKATADKAKSDLISKTPTDPRAALLTELRGRYAELVIELATEVDEDMRIIDGERLPKTIDAYCVSHAPQRNLTWEQCASAIVWFIGTSGKASSGPIEVSK